MVRFWTVFMLCAGFIQVLPVQTLLPYLGKNGKYGFADETGKIVFAPEVEGHMEAFGPGDLYKDLKKNGEGIRLFRSGAVVPNLRLVLGRPCVAWMRTAERAAPTHSPTSSFAGKTIASFSLI